MEFQSLSLIFIFTLAILSLWLAKNHKQKCKTKSLTHKHPPGPWKLPFIGNLHQLAAAGSLSHHALQKLAQKYGPLMHLQLGENSIVVVSSPNMAKEILKTYDLAFADRPQLLISKTLIHGTAGIVFAPYGDYWRQMRKICTLELLSVKRVQSFSYIREEEVTKLIESIQSSAGSLISVTSKVFSLTSAFVSRAAFGSKSKHQIEFISLVKEAVKLAGGFDLADLYPSMKLIHHITRLKAKLEKMNMRIEKILDDIIEENREKQMGLKEGKHNERLENLVEVLLRIQQSDSLKVLFTTDNIKAVIWDIFVGGTDTAATTMEWAMSELMRNPRVMEKAQTEIRQAFRGKKIFCETSIEKLNYLKLVVKETLRLHPPGPLLAPRECKKPCIIDGYEIPINTKVIVNAWAVGRDPEHWHDAERFIPERFQDASIDFRGDNFEYIPFGAGRRMCPGISFGVTSIEFPLAQLLFHFDWKLPDRMKPEDLDMSESFGGVASRKHNLYLIATPYSPPLHHKAN